MAAHLIDGEFQSDKYPTCPRGKVPLSTKDPTAQDLLWEYAQRRRAVDAEFAEDLEIALKAKGLVPRDPVTDAAVARALGDIEVAFRNLVPSWCGEHDCIMCGKASSALQTLRDAQFETRALIQSLATRLGTRLKELRGVMDHIVGLSQQPEYQSPAAVKALWACITHVREVLHL